MKTCPGTVLIHSYRTYRPLPPLVNCTGTMREFEAFRLDHQQAAKLARKLHVCSVQCAKNLLLLSTLSKTLPMVRFWSWVPPVILQIPNRFSIYLSLNLSISGEFVVKRTQLLWAYVSPLLNYWRSFFPACQAFLFSFNGIISYQSLFWAGLHSFVSIATSWWHSMLLFSAQCLSEEIIACSEPFSRHSNGVVNQRFGWSYCWFRQWGRSKGVP